MPVEIQGSWLRGTCGVVLQKNIKKLDNFSHFIVHDIGDGSKIACPVGKTTLEERFPNLFLFGRDKDAHVVDYLL